MTLSRKAWTIFLTATRFSPDASAILSINSFFVTVAMLCQPSYVGKSGMVRLRILQHAVRAGGRALVKPQTRNIPWGAPNPPGAEPRPQRHIYHLR